MSVSQSIDVAKSTLGPSGTPTTPLNDPFPPSPGGAERYKKLPLPLTPSSSPSPTRCSFDMSAWKKEVADAILKPMPSLELCGLEPKANSDEGSITVVYQSDIADKSPVRAKGEKLWLNTMMTPRTERHTLVSPQPQPQSSLPKIEKLSGLSNSNIPAFRETTPRGHNSGKKIRRLTGLEVHGEALDRYGEVSPLSSNGNDYGYGGPITAVFALDYYDVATVPSALPSPLCVVKSTRSSRQRPPRADCSPHTFPLSPREESGGARPKSPGPTRSDQSNPNLYYTTAKLIAKHDSMAVQKPSPSVQQPTEADKTHVTDGGDSSRGKQRTPMPNPGRRRRQPKDTPAAQPRQSGERAPATREVPKVQYYSHTKSASTSGQYPRSFHTQHSASPDRPPAPGPPSSFDFDSDSSPRTVGTPETGGSIPISIGSDTSGADAKASTATTTKSRHHRRRASFIAKVFGRAASTPNTPVPPVPPLSAAPKSTPLPALSPHSSSSSPSPPRTNPPRPVRTFPPLYPSLPRAATTAAAATTTTTTTTTMTVIKPPGRRQTDPTLTKTGLKAKKSMSALVGAAAGLIGVKSRSTGSGSWKGRAGEMTEEERRRWKEEVMKTIQVVPATGGEPGMLGEGVRMGGQQQQVRVGVGLGLI